MTALAAVLASTDSTSFAVLLLIVGLAGVLIELSHPGISVPGFIGVVALIAGALYLFDVDLPDVTVAPAVVVAVAIVLAVLVALAVRANIHTRRTPVTSGAEGLVGAEGRVTQALAPDGAVHVRGEAWSARLAQVVREASPTSVGEGTTIRVVAVRGLVLEVEPVVSSYPESGEVRS